MWVNTAESSVPTAAAAVMITIEMRGGNQAIFDGGDAGFVFEKTSDKIFHGRGSIC
jgi:hypothetical protein